MAPIESRNAFDTSPVPATAAVQLLREHGALTRKVDDGASSPLIHTRRGAGYMLADLSAGDDQTSRPDAQGD